MARSGGRTPYDKTLALAGPARVVWAERTVALPVDLSDIVQQVADVNGEYPTKTGWNDFGLAADAPSYSHDKDTSGLEYEQPTGILFEQLDEITRQFTAQIAEIDAAALKIIENTQTTEAIAASAAAAPDASRKSAQTKIWTGLYSSFRPYRIALISYRPVGAGEVIEAGATEVRRPPAVARVIPLCSLASEETSMDFESGEPTNAEVTFTINADTALGAGKEHGYWVTEAPGTILA